eukprot:jgi/Orpsp1_1/1192275/evm.model.d7180000091924.1
MTDKSGQELIEYEHENMKNYNYNNENFLIIQIFKMNNDAVIKSYLNHVNTHNISWNINIKDETNTYPLLYLIKNNNVECLKLLLEYVNSYNLTLNILDKNNDGNYPLLESVKYDGEGLKLLLEYAKIHNIILNITDKNNVGNYPLLSAANGNSENVKLLMDYARTHNIILNITDKNNDGNYPLLSAANSNSENVKLLIDYAKTHNIILNITDKNNEGQYPISVATKCYNIVTNMLLIEYANDHNITLNLDNKDIDVNSMFVNHYFSSMHIQKFNIENKKAFLSSVRVELIANKNNNDNDNNNNNNNNNKVYFLKISYNENIINFDIEEKGSFPLNEYSLDQNLSELVRIDKYFLLFETVEEVFNSFKKLVSEKNINLIEEDHLMKIKIYNSITNKVFFIIVPQKINCLKDENNIYQYINKLEQKISNLEEEIKEISLGNDKLKEKNIEYDKIIKENALRIEKLEQKLNNNENNNNNNNNINIDTSIYFQKSNIIKKDEINLILEWIEMKPKNFKLLLDSKINGDLTDTFYDACKDKKPTIVFIQSTDGYRFGGFTNETWPMKDFKEDSK